MFKYCCQRLCLSSKLDKPRGAHSQRIHLQVTPVPKTQVSGPKREQNDCKNKSIRDCALTLCLRSTSETLSIKSQQQNFPNVSWIIMRPRNLPNWMGESQAAWSLHKELQATKENWEWEKRSSQERSIPADCLVSKDQLWSIHGGNIIQMEQVRFRNAYVYTYMHEITVKKEIVIWRWVGEVYSRAWREERCNDLSL